MESEDKRAYSLIKTVYDDNTHLDNLDLDNLPKNVHTHCYEEYNLYNIFYMIYQYNECVILFNKRKTREILLGDTYAEYLECKESSKYIIDYIKDNDMYVDDAFIVDSNTKYIILNHLELFRISFDYDDNLVIQKRNIEKLLEKMILEYKILQNKYTLQLIKDNEERELKGRMRGDVIFIKGKGSGSDVVLRKIFRYNNAFEKLRLLEKYKDLIDKTITLTLTEPVLKFV